MALVGMIIIFYYSINKGLERTVEPLHPLNSVTQMYYPLEDDEQRARIRAKRRECLLATNLCNGIKFESVKQTECGNYSHGLTAGFGRHAREDLPVNRTFWEPKRSALNWSTERRPHSFVFSVLPRFVEKAVQVPAAYNLPEISHAIWKFSFDPSRPKYLVNHGTPGYHEWAQCKE